MKHKLIPLVVIFGYLTLMATLVYAFSRMVTQ